MENWELIIVQDGGNDVRDIIEKNHDPRIKLYKIEHGGKARALNFGFSKSAGKYIAYLDDDDYYLPNHLSILKENLSKSNLVITRAKDITISFVGGKEVIIGKKIIGKDVDFMKLATYSEIGQGSFSHERGLFTKVGGYNEKLRRFIDWEFLIRASRIEKPLYINKTTNVRFWYFKNNKMTNRISGLSDREPETVNKDREKIFKTALNLMTEKEKEKLLIDLLSRNIKLLALENSSKENEKNYKKEIKEFKKALEEKNRLIEKILNSKGWKMLEKIRKIKRITHDINNNSNSR